MAEKYEYKIVRVRATRESIGNAKAKPTGDDAYEQVIHQHAADGWRLCEIWSPPGMATAWLDLVFEREVTAS